MAGAMTARRYKNEIIRKMRSVGTYRDEYESAIDRTAALYMQLDGIEEQFQRSGGSAVIKHTNKAGATNLVKNPFLTARDEVYSQLLAYERELGLTPASLKRLNGSAGEGTENKLAAALREMSGG